MENMTEYGNPYGAGRYWIDQEWPSFCISFRAFEDAADGKRIDHIEGAYKIVKRRGKGKCIPIED